MSVQSNGTGPAGRRAKRFLSPSEKYEIWLALVRGEETIAQAADRAGVDLNPRASRARRQRFTIGC